MSADRFQQAALDLLTRGGCSVPMLGAEFVRRRLMDEGKTIGHAYAVARATLTDLVGTGKARAWPDGYCFTLPASTPIDTHPPTDAIHKRRERPAALEPKP
jgi:hypothetical protein